MNKKSVINQIVRFLDRMISFESFEDWILGHIQAASKSKDSETRALINQLDCLLIELEEHNLTDEEFQDSVFSLLQHSETLVTDFTRFNTDTLDVTFPLSIVSEQASEFHLVFGCSRRPVRAS